MPLFPLLEVFSDKIASSAALNMALDEVLWQTATTPRLRLYEWDHSAISFGYFGRYAEVAPYRSEHELVRRCTGGGIVFHGNDLTYALVIPSGDLASQSPMSVYRSVHDAIKTALLGAGIPATLISENICRASAAADAVPLPSHPPTRSYGVAGRDGLQFQNTQAIVEHPSNSCFANPVAADVMANGQKVAGAAQRRSRRGLLHQGSIQNIQLPKDFRGRFAGVLSARIIVGNIDHSLMEQAHRLAESKYQSESWLQRR